MVSKLRTKEESHEFLVRIGLITPGYRSLTGQEKEEMWMILQFIDPASSTNNQRFITEHYNYGDLAYSVTFFDDTSYGYDIIEITRL